MQWIIITKAPGALNADQEFTGPVDSYDEAMVSRVVSQRKMRRW